MASAAILGEKSWFVQFFTFLLSTSLLKSREIHRAPNHSENKCGYIRSQEPQPCRTTMKCSLALRYLSSAAAAFICGGAAHLARADDVNATNISIQQAALFGTIYSDATATATSEGLRIDTSQGQAEVYKTSITPAHYEDLPVTVEDWGWVSGGGYYQNDTSYQQTGWDYVPPIYDNDNNVITPENWIPHFEWVITNTYWVANPDTWAVVGSHTETQPVWVSDVTNTWTELTSGGVPRVRFNATRSDSNFVFRVPSPNGSDGMKDVLVAWEGGVTVPNADPTRTSVLGSDGLQQSWVQATNQTNGFSKTTVSSVRPEMMQQTTTFNGVIDGVWHLDTSVNETRPEFIRLTRTENVAGTSSVAQTQIAAKSANFAGVVEIAGDLKAAGAILVRPSGDLTMGVYTHGPQP